MSKNSEIESWLDEKNDPPQTILRRVREVILQADRRVAEYPKYGTVIFGYQGDMVSFVKTTARSVTLMFHRGARIEGRFPTWRAADRRRGSCASRIWPRSRSAPAS